MFKKDSFGQYLFLKKLMIRLFAIVSYPRFNYINKPVINGAELLPQLEDRNVLFVSNHQTYFADVAFMVHVIESALDGHSNEIWLRSMIKCPFPKIYFVAAEETMKSGLLPKLMGYAGAISIKRTWRASGKNIKRAVDGNDTENIKKALDSGWVITFPQGTTKPFADGRKGTAHIIKNYEPIVVPIVINGFRRAFDKKGLFLKKKGTELQVTIKQPLELDYSDNVDNILHKVMDSIEQSRKFEWRSNHYEVKV